MRKLTYEEIFSKRPTLKELQKLERLPIYVLAENIRSMHNVGSIFRSGDGARITKLFLTGFTPVPPRREIDKTALGATESVPWEYSKNPLPVLKALKEQGVKIAAVEHTNTSVNYAQVEYSFPVCLLVGNEVEGLSQEVVKEADFAVELPMLGIKQSLNVSVAFGIVLYHVLQQYLRIK
ncbi:MAG TPA: TrmH family RNA methyltransferase [Caldithrix abyssi]|uniref:TrmH family RNA methyltransferase n=1 Tax=Caldithrix abyssi TaxID=187145 RepID=A0A7V4WW48_CALAY|nr:TrmH family RNA methyltransferase [Caldithrix abyssi]